jgi:large subunit ribosomal protein L21
LFAIIQQGGKQYKVNIGDEIDVEKIEGEPGNKVELKDIIMIQQDDGTTLASDKIKDAKIIATIIKEGKHRKVIIFKKRRRETYRKKFGHRQLFTKIKINDIIIKRGDE